MSSIVKNTTEIVWTHNVDDLKDKYCVFHLKDGSCVCGWVDSIGVTSMIICDRYNCNARTLLTTELDPDMHYTQYELATGIMSVEPNSGSFMQYWLLSDKVTYEFDTESDLYKAFVSGNHIAVFCNKMNRDLVLYFIGFCDDDSIQVRFCEDNTIHKYSAEEFDKTFSDIKLFTPADKQTSDACLELGLPRMGRTEELINLFGTLCRYMIDTGRCDVICPYANTKDKDDECEAWRTIQKIG